MLYHFMNNKTSIYALGPSIRLGGEKMYAWNPMIAAYDYIYYL